jgi:hypothetical protein
LNTYLSEKDATLAQILGQRGVFLASVGTAAVTTPAHRGGACRSPEFTLNRIFLRFLYEGPRTGGARTAGTRGALGADLRVLAAVLGLERRGLRAGHPGAFSITARAFYSEIQREVRVRK